MKVIEIAGDALRGMTPERPPPLVGEGWGEGAVQRETTSRQVNHPLSRPLRGTLSHEGRG
ncbi:MAG: hypothetical protein LBU53_04450 [Zoogloeaceae bacterium]|nr:hypothetical protein [Zoogloeaceae bacterium]